MANLPSFTEYCDMVQLVEESIDKTEFLEDFLDTLDDSMLETVVVGDMAQVTAPMISKMPRRNIYEVTPPGMEKDALDMKPSFKKQYGDNYKQILYATLWKRYKHGKSK